MGVVHVRVDDTLQRGSRHQVAALGVGPASRYLEDRIPDALAALDQAIEVTAGATVLPEFPDGEEVYWTARFYTRLGRYDLGLAGFRAAVNQGYWCVRQFEQDAWLDPIRHQVAFVDALAEARQRQARAAGIFKQAGGPALLGVPS